MSKVISQYNATRMHDGSVSMALADTDGNWHTFVLDSEQARGLAESVGYYARPEDDELLGVPGVAEHVGINQQSVYSRIRHGSMPPPDIDIPDPRNRGRMRFWWRSTIERAALKRERGEGDIAGLFWAIVLFAALTKGCGVA